MIKVVWLVLLFLVMVNGYGNGNGNGNDPLESFRNSVELVKNAFGPLESSLRKVAKDFEHRWPGSSSSAKNGRKTSGNGQMWLVMIGRKRSRF